MSRFSDRVLVCRDCAQEFVFSSGEQEFYSTKGFSEPTRCPDCRQARKAARNGGTASFSGSASSTYGSRDSSSSYGTQGGGRQMYRVICADCGAETEVPFEPRSGRPVYCRNCFDRRSGRR